MSKIKYKIEIRYFLDKLYYLYYLTYLETHLYYLQKIKYNKIVYIISYNIYK